MTTFAALLLAFPLYLAVNGRLAAYIDLAKPRAGGGAAAASAAAETSGLADLTSGLLGVA